MAAPIGRRVLVNLVDGETVEGWLYDENPSGLYLALDPGGKHIRYVPRSQVSDTIYASESSKAYFEHERDIEAVEAAERLDNELSKELSDTLSRVDYNRARRIALQFRADFSALKYIEAVSQRSSLPDDRLNSEHFLRLALRVTDSYSNLVDELEMSGFAGILTVYETDIASFVSTDTLPWIDDEVSEPRNVQEMVIYAKRRDESVNTIASRDMLEKVTPERIVRAEIAAREEERGQVQDAQEALDALRDVRPRRLRRIAAFNKVALGGTFAATNLTLGAIAGVVLALPTLGIGTVGAAAGVATSVYTGLSGANDGLKDYASTLEEA
jgi:hypothetical protein